MRISIGYIWLRHIYISRNEYDMALLIILYQITHFSRAHLNWPDANGEIKIVATSFAEALRKLAAATSQRRVGIQYLKQKTIGDVTRRAMQLRWMHQRVPQQPDYYQVCMEWYDFRLIKTVITVSSAFHSVGIKIYEVSRVRDRHDLKRMRNTGKREKYTRSQTQRDASDWNVLTRMRFILFYLIFVLFVRVKRLHRNRTELNYAFYFARTENRIYA